MKRLLALLLAVLFLLAGCVNTESPETETETTVVTEPTDPGLYIPESDLEKDTNGAVRDYALEADGYTQLKMLGDRLLLIAEGENPSLLLLEGMDACHAAETQLSTKNFTVTQSGIAYVDEENQEAVYLDSLLQEAKRVSLPEELEGTPVFSGDAAQIYYGAGSEIRSLDTELEISRRIKTHNYPKQNLAAVYFNADLILCLAEDEGGNTDQLFVAAQDGATVAVDNGIVQLDTWQDQYMAVRWDGIVRQIIFGQKDKTPQQLNISQEQVYSALPLGGIISLDAENADEQVLSYYDLAIGKKTAELALPEITVLHSVCPDPSNGGLWLLGETESGSKLLFWNLDKKAVADDTVYTGPVFTAQATDEDGLKLLGDRVNQINKDHGVSVRIWQEATATTGDHALVGEYQLQAIDQTLTELEAVFAQFPADFLLKSVNTKIRVCIVRTIDGNAESQWFWDDGDAYILIPVGSDVAGGFANAMSYIVDSHILGNSPMYDYWEENNPEGFVYGDSLDESLLSGETQAFVNEKAMTSVTEDRASIFVQAMQADNAQMFQSETMQNKLLLLCKAIRDAWRLERKTESYVWEQYLNESIAYQK